MRECAHCQERWEGTEGEHPGCWVLAKIRSQETLPDPPTSDYAVCRPALSDSEWLAARKPS